MQDHLIWIELNDDGIIMLLLEKIGSIAVWLQVTFILRQCDDSPSPLVHSLLVWFKMIGFWNSCRDPKVAQTRPSHSPGRSKTQPLVSGTREVSLLGYTTNMIRHDSFHRAFHQQGDWSHAIRSSKALFLRESKSSWATVHGEESIVYGQVGQRHRKLSVWMEHSFFRRTSVLGSSLGDPQLLVARCKE